jgi:hypothetical protein
MLPLGDEGGCNVPNSNMQHSAPGQPEWFPAFLSAPSGTKKTPCLLPQEHSLNSNLEIMKGASKYNRENIMM